MRISSNSSFTTKSCACVSVALLAGNISWYMDSNYSCQYSFVDCRKRSCGFTYQINSNAEYVHSSNDSRLYLQSGTKLTWSWTVVLLLVMRHRVRNCQMTSTPLRVCTHRMTFIYPRTVLNSHWRSTSTQITASHVGVVTPPRKAFKSRHATNQDWLTLG
jgi:hypothetical protein